MPNQTLYESLEVNQYVEEIYQTSGQEYWLKAIATLRQFWAESTLDTIDSLESFSNSFEYNGIFLTNSPQVLSSNFYGRLLTKAWFFTNSQGLLLPLTLSIQSIHIVELDKKYPCNDQQFLIFISKNFSALFISTPHKFIFSLHPEPVGIAILSLKQFVTDHQQLAILNQDLERFPLIVPSYKIISKFALALLTQSFQQELPIPELREVDTIKAIAHEVKTPLTTIRTLAQSLLRRQDLTAQVRQRIEKINFECQDQIERFNLIFEIVQLNHQTVPTEPTNLTKILENDLPIWQKQAQRRQLSLNLELLTSMPTIISNGQLLSQLLNGLIDRLTRSLPPDSQIDITMMLMGKYIKLQFNSQTKPEDNILTHQALGQWLMIQPETGTLSLSIMISKVLFELIGGKLTIKTHPTLASYDGEILTIFLPIQV